MPHTIAAHSKAHTGVGNGGILVTRHDIDEGFGLEGAGNFFLLP